jgi:hypothetical protein
MNPQQANARLPLVKAIVKDAMERWRELAELRRRLADAVPEPGAPRRPEATDALGALEREGDRLEGELRGYVREIEELGAEVKDLELGLVDFPMRLGGRTVLLCWKAGEAEVRFWHEVDGGFAGRRPLAELR